MSKFIDAKDFELFKEKLKEDTASESAGSGSFARKWPVKNLKGTAERPAVYEIRFLPEASKSFFKRVHYHMVSSGEKWNYMVCPKTFDMNNYCPLCAASNKLYQGTEDDKNEAIKWKRKEKFVANILVVDDPRDASIDDEEKKNVGKVMLYEFPGQVEKVLREEINDSRRGIGMAAFDPGEDGYNFILKVGQKAGGKGKVWPEYSMQSAKKPSAIADSDKAIATMLEGCVNLVEYLEKSKVEENAMIELLKAEMVYDLIASEYEKRQKLSAPPKEENDADADKIMDSKKEEKPKAEKAKKSAPVEEELGSDDMDLLQELDRIGK